MVHKSDRRCGVTELEIADEHHVADGYDDLVRLEVSNGSVLVNPTEETASLINQGEIRVGDLLCVTPYRIDLVNVSGQ